MSDPSPERVRRARERGQVATSQRLTVAASLACALAAAGFTVRATREAFTRGLALATRAAEADVFPDLAGAIQQSLAGALGAMAPMLAASLGAMALVHALQTRFLVTWPDDEPARPSLSEAALGVVWTLALAVTACASAWSLGREVGVGPRTAVDAGRSLAALLTGVAWRVLAVAMALGLVELFWRRARFLDALRPTREEELRELREAEGDPRTRAERRRRMLAP